MQNDISECKECEGPLSISDHCLRLSSFSQADDSLYDFEQELTQNQVQYCQQVNKEDETANLCLACRTNFYFLDNFKLCLPIANFQISEDEFENCEFMTSINREEAHDCYQCIHGYVLEEEVTDQGPPVVYTRTCVPDTGSPIKNCASFLKDTLTCRYCRSGYALRTLSNGLWECTREHGFMLSNDTFSGC
jgi:hypothetical protein